MEVDDNTVYELLSKASCVDHNAVQAIQQLLGYCNSGIIRDVDFEHDRFNIFFSQLLENTWELCGEADQGFVDDVHFLLQKLQTFPEFNDAVAKKIFTPKIAQVAIYRALLRSNTNEEGILGNVIYSCYKYSPSTTRGSLRPVLAAPLKNTIENLSASRQYISQVCVMLRVLGSIIRGFESPLSLADRQLLFEYIMPLHHIPGKVGNLTPVLGIIHEPLCFCIVSYLNLESDLVYSIIQGILSAWPGSYAGNSPKEVLLLHELETVMEYLDVDQFVERVNSRVGVELLGKIAACLASNHSVICERALKFWQNEKVEKLLIHVSHTILPLIMDTLIHHTAKHWNNTVVKMCSIVLKLYREKTSHDFYICGKQYMTREELDTLVDELLQWEIKEAAAAEKTNMDMKAGTRVPEKEDASFMNMVRGKLLGEGSFGKVFQSYKTVKGKPRSQWPQFALKTIDIIHSDIALREIELMNKVVHPNCTTLVAMYKTKQSINLVLEYASNGDLHDYLAEHGSLDETSTRFVGAEIAAAVGAIHQAGLVFGDLKPENILIHGNGHVKLGDFGSARLIEDCGPGAPMEGTMVYLAPEIVKGESNGPSIDWWAFGCLIYQMLAGRPPIWAEDEENVASTIVHFEIQRFPSDFPSDASSLVTELLIHDPTKRLGFQNDALDIQDHAFFKGKLDFKLVHQLTAPEFTPGTVTSSAGKWTQRTYSMAATPLPKEYNFNGQQHFDAVHEGGEKNSWWNGDGNTNPSNNGRKPKYKPMLGKISEGKTSNVKNAAVKVPIGVKKKSAFEVATKMSASAVPPGRFLNANSRTGVALPKSKRKVKGKQPSSTKEVVDPRFRFKGLDLTAG